MHPPITVQSRQGPAPGGRNSPPSAAAQPPPPKHGGFTLVELLIALVVLGVLLSVALPTFMDQIRKSRRSEAFTAIATTQQAQERHRGNHAAYASAIASLQGLGAVDNSSGGRYAIRIGNASATGYDVIADGSASDQSSDGDCVKLALRTSEGEITYASCRDCSTFTFAASDRCWAR